MDRNDRLKELRMAMNGRMLLLFVGIMLIVNGITASGRTAIGWFNLEKGLSSYIENGGEASTPEVTEAGEASSEAAEAADETEAESAATQGEDVTPQTEPDLGEVLGQMNAIGLTTGDLTLFGIAALIAAIFEVGIGILCILFSNRVDKANITRKGVLALLVVEVLYMLFLFLKGALSLGTLFNALLLPAVLLWAVTRLCKLHALHPEMVYAVEQTRPQPKRMDPVPKKSLKERAGMNARKDSEEEK